MADRMAVYMASIHADHVRTGALQAHAYANLPDAKEWERHYLRDALDHFEKLAAHVPQMRERLAEIADHTAEAA